MKNVFTHIAEVISKDKNNHSYVFILNLVDISACLPFEIIPGHFLDRASPDFIAIFKDILSLSRPIPHNHFLYERSSMQEIQGEQPGHLFYQSDELPPEKWKYWIVSHDGNNHEIHFLQQASLLLKDEIEFGFEIGSLGEVPLGPSFSPAITSYLADEAFGFHPTAQVTTENLKSIWEYYSLIKEIKPEHEHIRNAVKLFADLRALPRHSDFVIIGLFSIIESLISHSPRLDFHHDSIRYQIKTKIPLLRKRFTRQLDYSEFFGDSPKEDKILPKLYDYRSALVHTGSSILSSDLSKVLKGKNEIKGFLMELTKQLLIISLKEPELVTDLKSC